MTPIPHREHASDRPTCTVRPGSAQTREITWPIPENMHPIGLLVRARHSRAKTAASRCALPALCALSMHGAHKKMKDRKLFKLQVAIS